MNKKFLLSAIAISVITGCNSTPEQPEPIEDNRTEQQIFVESNSVLSLSDESALYEKFDVDYTYQEYDNQVIELYIKDKVLNPTWVKLELNGEKIPVGVNTLPISNKELAKLGYINDGYSNTLLMGFDTFNVVDGNIKRLNIYEHLYFDTHFNIDSDTFLTRNGLYQSDIEFAHDGKGVLEVYGKVTFYKYNPETKKTWIVVDDDIKIFKEGAEVSYKATNQHYWKEK